MAAVSGVLATIQAFLKKGGSPDSADLDGRTLLRLAAGRGNASVCDILLKSGANPVITDRNGVNALRAAIMSGSPDTIALFDGYTIPLPDPEDSDLTTSQGQLDAPQASLERELGVPEEQMELEDGLGAMDWEPEPEIQLCRNTHPEDCQTKSEAVQERIARHRIIDRDADWSDIAVTIPAVRSGRLAQSFLPGTAIAWIERLVFEGASHGWVPSTWFENAAEEITDAFERQDLLARMEMLAGEMGIQIGQGDERVDLPHAIHDQDLEDLPLDLTDFLGDLESAWRDPLASYFRDIAPIPLLTPEEERLCGRSWQQDRNPEGVCKLVVGNLRFVVKEARRYQGLGLEIKDLVSEGNLGLIQGAKRFDPERETRFLTYAAWWIKQAIFHSLSEQGARFRLPQKVAGEVAQLNRVITQLQEEKGAEPTISEITAAGEFEEKQLARLLGIRARLLVQPEEEGWSEDLDDAEKLASQESDPLECLEEIEMRTHVIRALDILTDRERMIITLHFGIGDEEPLTLDQIGRMISPPISRERVRQIEERAFEKLRQRRRDTLADFLIVDNKAITIGTQCPVQPPEEWDESA